MAQVPYGRRSSANIGTVPASASSPSLGVPPSASHVPSPSPLKDSPRPHAKNTRKRGAADAPKANLANKLKNMVVEGSSSNTVASTFGSLAAENLTEDDAKLFKNQNDEVGETMFRSSICEAFYHGLRMVTYKNTLIKDHDKSLKKLKGVVHSLNTMLGGARKKAEEDAKAREDEIIHLKATLEESTKEAEEAKGEVTRLQGEIEASKAAFIKVRDEMYSEGFLDYLTNFLAVDPEYNWSRFPPSTPNFISNFKEKHAAAIDETKEIMRKQTQEENEKLAEEARDGSVNEGDAAT